MKPEEVNISDKDLTKYYQQLDEKKLTNWKQEPKISDLMNDLTGSMDAHSTQITKIDEWLKALYPETDTKRLKAGRSGVAPKVIRRMAEWRYGSLASAYLNERNLFTVNAYNPKYIESAQQAEAILNFQFNTAINKVKFINDLVRTAVNEGTAVIRIGWEIETQLKEKEIPVYQYVTADPQQAQMIEQIVEQLVQEQEQTGVQNTEETDTYKTLDPVLQESVKASYQYGMPVFAQDTGHTQIQKEQVQTKNSPVVQVINTSSLVVDPTCEGDFSKARFAIYCYYTSLSELKQAGIYKNLEQLEVNSTGVLPANSSEIMAMPDDVFNSLGSKIKNETGFTFKDKARKRLQAYEYWGYYDIDGTGIVQGIVATIVNGTLIRLERNPFPDGKLPFVVIPYLPVKNSIYGEPDGELIKDNQQIIQALTRSAIDINARSANAQTAMPKGYLDTTNRAKFDKGLDYDYNPTGMHPAEAIYMHTANEVPQSLLALLQSNFAEAESATGVKAFQNGIDGNAYGQVVAGMSQAITAITQREADIIFRLSKGLEEIGNKIVAMNAEWLNEEETVMLTDGSYQLIRRDEIQGDFFLNVSVMSNSESEGKAQQLTFMAQTLGQDADWGLRKMMMLQIARLYNLDEFYMGLSKYEPQPDPFQQEMQQLQLEEQRLKNLKAQEEAEYYRARSLYIQAQIDQANLDFLEQESGVDHQRKKEIVEAQAYAQNEGKIATEALKARSNLTKTKMDNDSKERVAKAKEQQKPNSSGGSTKKSEPSKRRGIPNPELGATPPDLFKADGLANYIKGDGQTVQNQI